MKNLIADLVKFQGEMKAVVKDSANPFYKSRYADLSALLEASMPLLSKNNLAVVQTCRVVEKDTVLQTRILHVSGEELLSEIFLPFISDVQKMGSQMTYYKRYSLQAALGISTSDEDDDGEKTIQRTIAKPIIIEKKEGFTNSKPQKFKLEDQTVVAQAPKGILAMGAYLIPVGKFKGRTLSEMDTAELTNYCKYIVGVSNADGNEITGAMLEFVNNTREYLLEKGGKK